MFFVFLICVCFQRPTAASNLLLGFFSFNIDPVSDCYCCAPDTSKPAWTHQSFSTSIPSSSSLIPTTQSLKSTSGGFSPKSPAAGRQQFINYCRESHFIKLQTFFRTFFICLNLTYKLVSVV